MIQIKKKKKDLKKSVQFNTDIKNRVYLNKKFSTNHHHIMIKPGPCCAPGCKHKPDSVQKPTNLTELSCLSITS